MASSRHTTAGPIRPLFRKNAGLALANRRLVMPNLFKHPIQSLAVDDRALGLIGWRLGKIVGRGTLAFAAEIELNHAFHGGILRRQLCAQTARPGKRKFALVFGLLNAPSQG